MPGCAGNTGIATVGPVDVLLTTAILAVLPDTSKGTWKLICCWPFTLSTANNGAAEPFTITVTFWNEVGSGSSDVRLIPVLDVRSVPKMVAISPGAIPAAIKLAPFTTALITGWATEIFVGTRVSSTISPAPPGPVSVLVGGSVP